MPGKETFKALRQKAAQDMRFFLPGDALAKWKPDVHAVHDSDDAATINIYDIVGEDFWSGAGMTAKTVSAILRKNKGNDVTVNINSPGGDVFEGIAIYNMLREHEGNVTVRVVGMAASIASIIAMAGDDIKIAESAFFMVHNSWHFCVGNKHDMQERADTLAQFDDAMIGIYTKATGLDKQEITDMLDAETWISGSDALEKGFATAFLDSDELAVDDKEEASYNASLKELEVIMAKAGKSRSERRRIIKNLTSTPGAAVEDDATPRAGADENDLAHALVALTETLKK